MKFCTFFGIFSVLSCLNNEAESLKRRSGCPRGFYLDSNGVTCVEGTGCPAGSILDFHGDRCVKKD